ncbi:MAG: arylsulfatase [Candidatus Sumerlaeota bacterium]|nr:arylsulfatase [Candidatus Sumerlaeota bacterium]
MNRREFAKLAAGLGAAAFVLPRRLEAAGKRPPNILYVVLDEWGYYEMSGLGNKYIETPVIDRLAREGMRFTQLLAGGPVCAPTRCALMTGKHPGHMTVRANGGADPLRADEPTIASMLKQAGYATGGFGKWGLGARGTSGVPEKHGFDIFFGYYDQVHAHCYFPLYLIRNSQEVPLEGNTGDFYKGIQFSQRLIFDQTKQFIRDNKDRPFFCYCPWTPPHGNWGIPEDDPSWLKFKDKPWKAGQGRATDARVYAAMVHMDDRQIGELLDLLRELNLADNTLVVVTGDNGDNDYFTHDVGGDGKYPRGFFGANVDPLTGAQFRGHKGQLYEGGLRVQAIAYWPGKIQAGAVSNHLCCFYDVLPTLAEITGAQPPAEIDGVSFAPTLLGQPEQRQHDYLYWESGQQAAVRIGQYKGIRPRGKGEWELYDLDSDIGEQHNIAAEHPDVVARMKSIAEEAHTPVRPGEILDRALLEKDRRAGMGNRTRAKPAASEPAGTQPTVRKRRPGRSAQ